MPTRHLQDYKLASDGSLNALRSFYETYNKQQDDGADGGTDNISNREAAWDHSGEEPAGDDGAQDTYDDVS